MSGEAREDGEFHRLALEKMSSVLGATRARQLLTAILDSTGLTLESADDLYAFSLELAKHRGFEGAVGGLLGVQAVLHGATRPE